MLKYRFILLLMPFLAVAQETDSLLNALKQAKPDSNKVILLNTIANAFFNQDKSKSQQYTLEALKLARAIRYTRGEAKSINSIGILVQKDGNYDSAIVLQNQALELYKKLSDKKGIAKAYSDIANAEWRKSEFTTALDFQIKALKIYEEIKDQKGEAYCYNMMGIIYKNLKKDSVALQYYLKSATIKKQIGDEKGLASTYQNIANIYKTLVKTDSSFKDKQLRHKDSALKYYSNALVLHRKNGNKTGEGFVISGLGSLMYELKLYTEAKKYFIEGMKIEESFLDSNSLATSYINIGMSCTALRDYKEGEEYLKKGLDILMKLGDQEGVMSAYEMLAYLYQQTGDYKKAMECNLEYFTIRDSIMGLQEKAKIGELQVQYEVEKKDLQLAKDKAEIEAKEKQVFVKNLIIASILVVVVLGSLLIFSVYRRKKIQQQAELAEEMARQRELRNKAVIEAEEKERRRIAQDLHDGVGQILSAAKLNLSNYQSKITAQSQEEKDALKNAVDLIDDSVKEVRAVSHNMMPNTLIKLGLASAVREFITKIGNVPNLKIDLEIVGLDKRLPEQTETVLYRVIQEIVNNIIKHSKANHVGLQLIKHDTEFTVMIEDNGVGFDTAKISEFSGIGLKNIISRVEFLNGTVDFDSTPGHGTNVIIEIPLT
jgi:two-component system, NarL family, sensor kinase